MDSQTLSHSKRTRTDEDDGPSVAKRRYQLAARRWFVTWAQCPIAIQQMKDFLASMGLDEDQYLGVKEMKEDHPHYHVIIDWISKKNTKNPRFLDIMIDGVIYHPSMEGVKSFDASHAYVTKQENPDDEVFGSLMAPEKAQVSRRAVALALNKCKTAEEAKAKWDEMDPRFAWFNSAAQQHALQIHFGGRENQIDPLGDEGTFAVPLDIRTWVDDSLRGTRGRRSRNPTLVIVGPAKMGKTLMCHTFGRHLYFKEEIKRQALLLCNEVEYVVFDDISPQEMRKVYKSVIGGHESFTMSDKYMAAFTVKWNGLPAIVIMNEAEHAELLGLSGFNVAWWEDNTITVKIETSLFK